MTVTLELVEEQSPGWECDISENFGVDQSMKPPEIMSSCPKASLESGSRDEKQSPNQ